MAANKFSCKSLTIINSIETKFKNDINDFILVKLNSLWVSPIFLDERDFTLVDNYFNKFWKIAIYLITLYQPPEMDI